MKMLRRNALIHFSDAGSFFIGVSLCSFAVIIPSYVKSYTANAFLLAMVPVVIDLGMSLPQTASVFFFKYIRNRGRGVRNTIHDYMFIELLHRATFILIGISIFVFAHNATAALISFFVCFIISNISWGIVIPNWIDVLTVTIPDRGRTSFMAKRELVGRLIGIIASLAVPFILVSAAFPYNYGRLFLIAGFFFTAGIIPARYFHAITRITAVPHHHRITFGRFLKEGVALIFKNTRLIAILRIFWCLGISRLTYAYYTPYVIDRIISRYPAAMKNFLISGLNMSLLIFLILVPLFVGKMIGRIGYRRSLFFGAASLFMANTLILVFPTYAMAIAGQFFLALFMMSAYFVSLNALMDYTVNEERSTASSVNNTVNALCILAFSLGGSTLANKGGYASALIAAAAVAALVMIIMAVRKFTTVSR